MADYHEVKPPPSPSSAQTTSAPQQTHNATSSYQYQSPPVASGYSIDGLPPSSSVPLAYGHGPRAQGPSFPASNNLNVTSQPGQQQGSQQQQLNSSVQQHHGNVSPSLQFPPAAPANNVPSGSPPGHHALTPTDSVSPPSTNSATAASSKATKSTRIPRACDLCSQRKVKVRNLFAVLSPHGQRLTYCQLLSSLV